MSSDASNASSAGSTAEPFFTMTVDDAYLWEVVAENVTSIDIREDLVEGDLWEAVDQFVRPDNVEAITDATMARLTASRDYLRNEIREHVKAGERYSHPGPLTPNSVLWDLVSEVIADEMHTLFNQPAFWRGLITAVESETIPGMTPDTEEAG
jgi:hypothetical protein